MAGPRQLWKTVIVIWSENKPPIIMPERIRDEAGTYVVARSTDLISDPYSQPDGPPEEFFE
jgi:hypothetical protein